MESQGSTQLRVGIFLSIGLAIILTSIFMIGADRALFTKYVHIHANFDQVQGLAEGSVVSLSGITVGNIEKIEYNHEKSLIDVQMKIDSLYAKKISKSSQVEIRTQGALGDKYIFIMPGQTATETLQDGDVLEVAKASDILGIISERGNETSKIFDIINEMYKLTKQINAENRVDKIMNNLAQATASLNATSSEAKKMFTDINSKSSGQKLQNSIERMDSILTKIDRGEGTLGALINDPSLHSQLKTLLGGSNRKNNLKSIIRTSIEKQEE